MEEYPANGEHFDVKNPISLENPKQLAFTQQHKEGTFRCFGVVDFRRRPPTRWTSQGRETSQGRGISQARWSSQGR